MIAAALAAELARPWAIEPTALGSLLLATQAAPPMAIAGGGRAPRLRVAGKVARIPVQGPLLRSGLPGLRAAGVENTGLDELRAQLREALSRPKVTSVLLEVDSPGGAAQGLAVLADEIHSAPKPVHAHVSARCMAGAYYLASQARSITAEPDALVGSIGVIATVFDHSEALDETGVTVHALRSGPLKGFGAFGVPISEDQVAMHQRAIDALGEAFVDAVARGRRLDRDHVRATVATGAHWVGTEAKRLGLVDAIGNADAALARAAQESN